ncbi:helix-turn-helix transcriptional regulator, partial [Acinetobacter baumannii]
MKDSFGARLKFFRSKAGLSQQQLADKTGLSRKIISDYEVKLDVIPRDSNLYKIADALGVDSSNLIPKTRGDATEQPD